MAGIVTIGSVNRAPHLLVKGSRLVADALERCGVFHLLLGISHDLRVIERALTDLALGFLVGRCEARLGLNQRLLSDLDPVLRIGIRLRYLVCELPLGRLCLVGRRIRLLSGLPIDRGGLRIFSGIHDALLCGALSDTLSL